MIISIKKQKTEVEKMKMVHLKIRNICLPLNRSNKFLYLISYLILHLILHLISLHSNALLR